MSTIKLFSETVNPGIHIAVKFALKSRLSTKPCSLQNQFYLTLLTLDEVHTVMEVGVATTNETVELGVTTLNVVVGADWLSIHTPHGDLKVSIEPSYPKVLYQISDIRTRSNLKM